MYLVIQITTVYCIMYKPIDGDAEDGVDGTEADGVVERQPEIAEDLAERPALSSEQVDGVERHRDGPDEKVANGERRDEVVGRLTYRPLQDERQDDDEVPGDGDEADGRRQGPDNGDLPSRERVIADDPPVVVSAAAVIFRRRRHVVRATISGSVAAVVAHRLVARRSVRRRRRRRARRHVDRGGAQRRFDVAADCKVRRQRFGRRRTVTTRRSAADFDARPGRHREMHLAVGCLHGSTFGQVFRTSRHDITSAVGRERQTKEQFQFECSSYDNIVSCLTFCIRIKADTCRGRVELRKYFCCVVFGNDVCLRHILLFRRSVIYFYYFRTFSRRLSAAAVSLDKNGELISHSRTIIAIEVNSLGRTAKSKSRSADENRAMSVGVALRLRRRRRRAVDDANRKVSSTLASTQVARAVRPARRRSRRRSTDRTSAGWADRRSRRGCRRRRRAADGARGI